MNDALHGKVWAEPLYGYGKICTWHGPLKDAVPAHMPGYVADAYEATHLCPVCALPLLTITPTLFWYRVATMDRRLPQYEAMMRWSEGKCFGDFETLQNAWRQEMEGQQ